MKYFVVLAEERSFTKAAEKLHVTQQTLSAHVAGLEKESGAKLFIRHVPLELTDAGRRAYPPAQASSTAMPGSSAEMKWRLKES